MEKAIRILSGLVLLAAVVAFFGCGDSDNGTPVPVFLPEEGDPDGAYLVLGDTREELPPYTKVGGVYISYCYHYGGEWVEIGETESGPTGRFYLIMCWPGTQNPLPPGTWIQAETYKAGYGSLYEEFRWYPGPNRTMYRDLHVRQHAED